VVGVPGEGCFIMQRDEFERFALEHLDAVYRMAYQLTRNRERAEDLVQDVYVRALKPGPSDRFKEQLSEGAVQTTSTSASDSVRSWLFTITHNTFLSNAKKRLKDQAMLDRGFHHNGIAADGAGEDLPAVQTLANSVRPNSQDQVSEATEAGLPPSWKFGADEWEALDQRLKAAINGIKPEYREALLLWGLGGMKYREIAEVLDVPIGTVMSRLYRARQLLADALGAPNGPAAELGMRPSQLQRARQEREAKP